MPPSKPAARDSDSSGGISDGDGNAGRIFQIKARPNATTCCVCNAVAVNRTKKINFDDDITMWFCDAHWRVPYPIYKLRNKYT